MVFLTLKNTRKCEKHLEWSWQLSRTPKFKLNRMLHDRLLPKIWRRKFVKLQLPNFSQADFFRCFPFCPPQGSPAQAANAMLISDSRPNTSHAESTAMFPTTPPRSETSKSRSPLSSSPRSRNSLLMSAGSPLRAILLASSSPQTADRLPIGAGKPLGGLAQAAALSPAPPFAFRQVATDTRRVPVPATSVGLVLNTSVKSKSADGTADGKSDTSSPYDSSQTESVLHGQETTETPATTSSPVLGRAPASIMSNRYTGRPVYTGHPVDLQTGPFKFSPPRAKSVQQTSPAASRARRSQRVTASDFVFSPPLTRSRSGRASDSRPVRSTAAASDAAAPPLPSAKPPPVAPLADNEDEQLEEPSTPSSKSKRRTTRYVMNTLEKVTIDDLPQNLGRQIACYSLTEHSSCESTRYRGKHVIKVNDSCGILLVKSSFKVTIWCLGDRFFFNALHTHWYCRWNF